MSNLTWNVPPHRKNGSRHDMVWPTYVYHVIMKYDARLHSHADLCRAFNHLVEVLDTFQSICYTYTPEYALDQYDYILLRELEVHQKPWEQIPVRFYRTGMGYGLYAFGNRVSQAPFVPTIYEAYKPLYDLMEQYGVLSWVREQREKLE